MSAEVCQQVCGRTTANVSAMTRILPTARLIASAAALAVLVPAALGAAGAGAAALEPASGPATASLPSVSSGARPGPDVLYAPPPAAPPLENRDPRFHAAPLLVSGHEAYVDGEYLYQEPRAGASTESRAPTTDTRPGPAASGDPRCRHSGGGPSPAAAPYAVAQGHHT